MERKSPRSFRLSEGTQKQMALLAGKLGVNQTDIVEMAVNELASEHLAGDVDLAPRIMMTSEGLARDYDEVADIIEGDPDSPASYRENVSRLMRGTAKSLRGEKVE